MKEPRWTLKKRDFDVLLKGTVAKIHTFDQIMFRFAFSGKLSESSTHKSSSELPRDQCERRPGTEALAKVLQFATSPRSRRVAKSERN